jgi:hypothetical protein
MMSRLNFRAVTAGTAVLLLSGAPVFPAGPGQTNQAGTARQTAGPLALALDVVPGKEVERFEVPAIDLEAVWEEDDEREREGLAPRYAIPNDVWITPDTHGTWEQVREGLRQWRLRISAPGAVSINLGFTRYFMPPGGQLQVHSLDERLWLRPFTEQDNEDHGELWTPIVPSEDIVVEVVIPIAASARSAARAGPARATSTSSARKATTGATRSARSASSPPGDRRSAPASW